LWFVLFVVANAFQPTFTGISSFFVYSAEKITLVEGLVCCNRDMFTKGHLSPALSSSGGEGEETQAGHIYCVKL
jgi:hypothetical protein